MFAGPNGSGKSTLKSLLPEQLLGIYLNPDDIEKEIRAQGVLDLAKFQVAAAPKDLRTFFHDSQFLQSAGLGEAIKTLGFENNRIDFSRVSVNSYLASAAVEFIRHQLLRLGISFTFETVMSHRSKVAFLDRAQTVGFRTYLYYIATDDPAINISRVRNRVILGGHSVPVNKIESRYHASLALLMDAIKFADRAYLFDNSGENKEKTWLAEITDGERLVMHQREVPAWFARAVLDKIP